MSCNSSLFSSRRTPIVCSNFVFMFRKANEKEWISFFGNKAIIEDTSESHIFQTKKIESFRSLFFNKAIVLKLYLHGNIIIYYLE